MKETTRLGLYYVLSGAAAAASLLTVEEAVAQTCGTCAPTTLSKYFGPQEFVETTSTSESVELAVDNFYGFKTNTAPQVFLDFQPTTSTSGTIHADVCLYLADLSFWGCATPADTSQASTAYKEIVVPVNTLYHSTNSLWDHYQMQISCSGGCTNILTYLGHTNKSVPIILACW